jgi:hypothetical protein
MRTLPNLVKELVHASINMISPDLSLEEIERLYALQQRLEETEPDSSGCDHIHTCGFCAAREEMRKNA